MEKTRGAAPLAPAIFYFLILQLLVFFSTADGQHSPHGPPIVIPSPSAPCARGVVQMVNSLSLHFKMSSPVCARPWPLGLVFMYEQSKTDKSHWSFILVADDYGGYISVGSSSNGSMIGASAIAGWISSSGEGIVKTYYLGGYSSSACVPGQGSLRLVPGSASIVSSSKTLFLGFQLISPSDPDPHVIFAVGPPKRLPGPDFLLPMHYAQTSSILL